MARKTNSVAKGKEYCRVRHPLGRDKEGNYIYKNFYGESLTDAEHKRDEWLVTTSKGLRMDSTQSLTMAMYTWFWNIEKPSGLKSSSFERYYSDYRNHIDDSRLGFSLLEQVDKLSVQSHYREMYSEGKSYSQIKNTNKVLNKFFRFCLSEGYILRNPCFGIKFDAYRTDNELAIDDELEEEGKIETFSDEDIKKIVHGDYNPKLQMMARFALGTGLRQGELLALDVSDVDINGMTAKVTKTLTNMKIYDTPTEWRYELTRTTPKTKKSRRYIPIPPSLEKDIMKMRTIRNEEKLKLGNAYNDNSLMFPSELGNYMDARNLLRSWKRALERIGVEYKGFHALRHTYATQLIMKGEELITVSRLLGHSSIKTTEKYTHILKTKKASGVEVLDSLFL